MVKTFRYNFIYLTRNKITGKIYVGKHQTNTRDDGYLGSGTYLERALHKYGRENFEREILEECASDLLSEREIYWIDELKVLNKSIGYNFAEGGMGGHTGNYEAVRKKAMGRKRPDMVGENNPMKSSLTARKLSERFKGIPKSEEHKKKVSETKVGQSYGPMSEAHKQKISKRLKGIPKTAEQRRKISEGHKRRFLLKKEKENG